MATELVARGRTSCARVSTPTTYAIPFTDMTWLCAPDRSPRLVGRGPGAMRAAVLTASDARIAGDFRALELDDARLLLTAEAPQPTVAIRVASLSMRGMAPWAQASTLPAWMRALVLALTAWAVATLCVLFVLRRAVRTRLAALALGASGPCTALGLLRLLERADMRPVAFVVVPLAACAVPVACALLVTFLSRLRHSGRAASTTIKV